MSVVQEIKYADLLCVKSLTKSGKYGTLQEKPSVHVQNYVNKTNSV